MRTLSQRYRVIDVAVVVWALVWVVVGLRVAEEMRGLSELSGTVIDVGAAVQTAGEAIGTLSSLPLAGEQLEEPSEAIRSAGQSAVESGRSSRESIRDLSTLLGFAIAVIPTAPLLFLYIPARIAWTRDRRALARALRESDGLDDRELTALLARRALAAVPYRRLVHSERWSGEPADGDVEVLAAAELRRMGLSVPRRARRR